jgi:dihydropteroate synthase
MSFPYRNQRVHIWGVVNATPNSFSDGGEVTTSQDFERRMSEWKHLDGLDVGAESTAPKNTAITAAEERQRLEHVLVPHLRSWPRSLVLSLDTYHLETAEWLIPQVPQDVQVVWNDVSGQIEPAVIKLLQAHPRLRYVLCFNQVPQRALTSQHMQHATPGPIVARARSFFRESFEVFLRHELFSRVIADPCFGFSKTREQNHQLLDQLPILMDELACPVWMWGVSRKSFLRFPVEAQIQRETLDGLGLLWINTALDKLTHPHTIILRTHAPLLANALGDWQQLRDQWTPNS